MTPDVDRESNPGAEGESKPEAVAESHPDARHRRSISLPEWPDDLPRRLMEWGRDRPADGARDPGAARGSDGARGAGAARHSGGGRDVKKAPEAKEAPDPQELSVAGDRAAVRFGPGTGIDEIHIHPHAAARAFELRVTPGAAERVEIAPGTVRRRLTLDHGSLVESTLVLQRLPGVVLQWEHAASAGTPDDPTDSPDSTFDLEVSWSLPAAARPELPDGPSGPLLVYFPDPDAGSRPTSPSESASRSESKGRGAQGPELRIEPVGGEVSWEITPEASAPSREAPSGPGAADGENGHKPARAKHGDRITLRSSLVVGGPLTLLFATTSGGPMQQAAIQRRFGSLDAELVGRAAADARAAETELALRTDDPRTDEAFAWRRRELHGAVGHGGDGKPVLRDPRGGATPHPEVADVAAIGTELLALGRHRDADEFVDRAVDLLPSVDHPGTLPALLLFVARHTLWTGDSRALRRLDTRLEEWLTHPGIADSISSTELHRTVVECADAVEAAGERERADRIRSSLGSAGVLEGERPDRVSDATSMAFISPSDLLLKMLGGRADAFVGRLRLAPRFPEGRTRITVDGIRMGDSRMRLAYHAVGSRHTFRLEPTEGRVPMNLVFEPLLPEPGPGRSWVDGDPAEVDRYRSGDRVGVRLQLPLDAPREVVVEVETKGRRG